MARHNAGRALREWMARIHHKMLKNIMLKNIRDVWGSEMQDEHVIRGRIRVTKETAKQLVTLSGDSVGEVPWFIEPTHWPSLGENQKSAHLWIPTHPEEDALAYLQRARKKSNGAGLMVGNKQVAVLVAISDARMQPIICSWKLEETLRNFSYENVEEILTSTGFIDVELIAKSPRREG